MGKTATLTSTGMPAINEDLIVGFHDLTLGCPLVALIGASDSFSLGVPLPLPMSVIFPGSGTGCSVQVSQDLAKGIYLPEVDGTGMNATLRISVPNNPALIGLVAFVQGIQIEYGPFITAANTAYGQIVIGQF
jgi:hypothetical protein